MSKVLIFDTETTGLPPRGVRPDQIEMWNECRVVEFAWEVVDSVTGKVEDAGSCIVRPGGEYKIPKVASNIHGITTAKAEAEGVCRTEWLAILQRLLPQVSTLVAHNLSFDLNVVAAELYRADNRELADAMTRKMRFCTMRAGTKPRQKWPKLVELYGAIFGEAPSGQMHRAGADVAACRAIYLHFMQHPETINNA